MSTLEIIRKFQKQFGITCMHHFTLVNQTAEELTRHIELMMRAGVRNVLALRGDPPKEMGDRFKKIDGGLEYCYELIDLILGFYTPIDGNRKYILYVLAVFIIVQRCGQGAPHPHECYLH